jgi:hypothetical protein
VDQDQQGRLAIDLVLYLLLPRDARLDILLVAEDLVLAEA